MIKNCQGLSRGAFKNIKPTKIWRIEILLQTPIDDLKNLQFGAFLPLMMVPSLSSVSFIDNLPSETHSVHDIRLRFKTDGIWSTIRCTHPEMTPNEVSKDISLLPIQTYDLEAKTVVHSDTVSVIISINVYML
jgi:hypothetical protein